MVGLDGKTKQTKKHQTQPYSSEGRAQQANDAEWNLRMSRIMAVYCRGGFCVVWAHCVVPYLASSITFTITITITTLPSVKAGASAQP